MSIGRCRNCQTPYTRDDVAAYGILKARTAARGGPRVLYRCPKCSVEIELVPHGYHRYGPPGKPPPVSRWADEQNRNVSVPWEGRASQADAKEPGGNDETRRDSRRSASQTEASPKTAPLMTQGAARDLLGVALDATPGEIDEAFRQKAQACHPDKVTHLDPAIQDFARKRFLELRAAYDLILESAPPGE